MKILLETSFLIELRKRNKKAIEALRKCVEFAEDILVSSISIFELMYGAYKTFIKTGSEKQINFVYWITKTFRIIPIDEKVCLKAGKMKATIRDPIPDADILIAASCDENTIIYTFDKHFERLGVNTRIFK